jgi:hypothetical protein
MNTIKKQFTRQLYYSSIGKSYLNKLGSNNLIYSSLVKFQFKNKVDNNNIQINQKNKQIIESFSYNSVVSSTQQFLIKSKKNLVEQTKSMFDVTEIVETYKFYKSGTKMKLTFNKYKKISLTILPYGLLTFITGANLLCFFGYMSYPIYFNNLINLLSFYSVYYTTINIFTDVSLFDKDDEQDTPYDINLYKNNFIYLISVFVLSSITQVSSSLFLIWLSYFGISITTVIALNKVVPTFYKKVELKPKHVSKKCLMKILSLVIIAQLLGISIYCLLNFKKVEEHFNYSETLESAVKVLQSSDKNFITYYQKVEDKMFKKDLASGEKSLN